MYPTGANGDDIRRGSASSGRIAKRAWRAARVVVLPLLLVFGLSGCGFIGKSITTVSALQRAGFHDVGINIQTGSESPPDGLVDVSFSRGPTGNAESDASTAERIVWDTLAYRFGLLVIIDVSGGCTGPVCVSQSSHIATDTYAQLSAKFGPRPAGLDATSADSAIAISGWVIALVALLFLGLAAAIVIVVVMMARRRRRRYPQPPLTLPPGPWAWPTGSPPPGP